MHCDCGSYNEPNARYCVSCGVRLNLGADRDPRIDLEDDNSHYSANEDSDARNIEDARAVGHEANVKQIGVVKRGRTSIALGAVVILLLGGVAFATQYRKAINVQRAAKMVAERRALAAERRIAETNAITAQRDSLLGELMTSTAFMNQIVEEMSNIKTLKRGNLVQYKERLMPMQEYRAALLARIKDLGALVDSSEARLQTLEARLRDVARSDATMTARVAEFERLVGQYRHVIEDQRSQIERLMAQVGTLQTENARLTREKVALSEQYMDLAETTNTVYWIAGTKAQLLELGIILEEGGRKGFLGIGGRKGVTIVPARELHEADFTPLSKTADVNLTLPNADKTYQIVSRQNASYLSPIAKDGTIRGTVHINNPAQFWGASKFLIVVEK